MNEQNEAQNLGEESSVISEDEMLKNLTILEIIDSINILDYEKYLDSIKVQGKAVKSWSAEGVKNFAFVFKISVGPITIEPLDNDGLLMQAQGHSRILDIEAPALIFQPFEKKKQGKDETEPDDHWSARGAGRLIRNARKHLLPLETLMEMLFQAQADRDSLGDLMGDVSEAWDEVSEAVAPLTKKDCLKAAENMYGAQSIWDNNMWQQFMVDLRNHATNYLNDYRDNAVDKQNTNEALNDDNSE